MGIISKIRHRDLFINDQNAIEKIKIHGVEYLTLNKYIDDFGDIFYILSAPTPDIVSLGNKWSKIYHHDDGKISIRTPNQLKKYIGKNFNFVSCDPRLGDYDLMIIQPSGFEIKGIVKRNKKPVIPYITRNLCFVIPYDYFNNLVTFVSQKYYLCFDKSYGEVLQSGFLYGYISNKNVRSRFNLSLYTSTNGMRTHKAKYISKTIRKYGFNLNNYVYAPNDYENYNKNSIIIFTNKE